VQTCCDYFTVSHLLNTELSTTVTYNKLPYWNENSNTDALTVCSILNGMNVSTGKVRLCCSSEAIFARCLPWWHQWMVQFSVRIRPKLLTNHLVTAAAAAAGLSTHDNAELHQTLFRRCRVADGHWWAVTTATVSVPTISINDLIQSPTPVVTVTHQLL